MFQLVCILAVILLPDSETDNDSDTVSEEDDDVKSRAGSPSHLGQNRKHHRKKHEKKKKQL